MSCFSFKRGSIIIALLFIMILSITAVAFLAMLGGRSTFTANQLKRAQAINCAEAALYETFNRVRSVGAGHITPGSGVQVTIQVPVVSDATATPVTTYNVPVVVTFSTNPQPYTVRAKVRYDDIRM